MVVTVGIDQEGIIVVTAVRGKQRGLIQRDCTTAVAVAFSSIAVAVVVSGSLFRVIGTLGHCSVAVTATVTGVVGASR